VRRLRLDALGVIVFKVEPSALGAIQSGSRRRVPRPIARPIQSGGKPRALQKKRRIMECVWLATPLWIAGRTAPFAPRFKSHPSALRVLLLLKEMVKT
jgi:hypothetical protein